MTAKPKPRPEILNPFYKDATPEQVAEALLKYRSKEKDKRKPPKRRQ